MKVNNITSGTRSISDKSTIEKISFFGALSTTVGTAVGSGIFFKTGSIFALNDGSFVASILTWLLGAFAVVSMAFALIEIASVKNADAAYLDWIKKFNSEGMYGFTKFFLCFAYLPIIIFALSWYFVTQVQDGIHLLGGQSNILPNSELDFLIWLGVTIALILVGIFVFGVRARVSDWVQRIINVIKIVPIATAIVLGFVYIGVTANFSEFSVWWKSSPLDNEIVASVVDPNSKTAQIVLGELSSLQTTSPIFGLIFCLGGIFFAYDGFYVSAGLQKKMKKPDSIAVAMVSGLCIVTIIYLLIAISMSLNGTGSFLAFGQFLGEHNATVFFAIINVLIGVGILGPLFGFCMFAPNLYEKLIDNCELPFAWRIRHKVNPNRPMVGAMYLCAIWLPMHILFTIIGVNYFTNGSNPDIYSFDMTKLLAFVDLVTNWMSFGSFVFIAIAIFGGLRNRKTNKVEVKRYRYFVPAAITSLVLMSIGTVFQLIVPFYNLAMVPIILDRIDDVNADLIENGVKVATDIDSFKNQILISRLLMVIAFIIILTISSIGTFAEKRMRQFKEAYFKFLAM